MNRDDWEAVWTRAREGSHTLVRAERMPPPPTDLKLVVVDCGSTAAVLEEACRRVERLLGAGEQPQGGSPRGLRHGLLGELPERPAESRFVELGNRLAQW
ncbi:MAG: hypothetical protein R3310_10695, partial [Candidatus Competibacteraceae bacterium]|nr:hypothetical protein [Candidatus Competibacteraceae bacterium]